MANSYFDFKQFRIEQGNCGMKVSTDACIQGAWTPVPHGACRILDAGAGTGLLSLMLAQRAPEVMIDALEIDEAAAIQAGENISASAFADRIHIHHQDVRSFQPEDQYDLIICNPPFFINSLNSPEAARNLARHNHTLQQKDLLDLFDKT
jgi:tRNA1Val (adenine37-N6)-methyltransferase